MVVIDITSEPAELNPMLFKDAISIDVLRHCMSGLARLDAGDNAVPDLAERWENNADNTETTVYLRKDARWSNGEPVTANDFYYSWLMQMKPETGATNAVFLYDRIKNGADYYGGKVGEDALGLTLVDEHTLKIEWARPMASAGYFLAFPSYLPMNQKAYEEIGADKYASEAANMVFSGAYKMTEWVHDDHILLEKNEGYWDAARISIPKIKLVMIGDSNTRLNSFLAGEVDMCNLYAEQITQVVQQNPDAARTYDDGGSWYLNYNVKSTYLANADLRRALAYAVDVQSLLDNVIKDGSVAADGLVPHSILGVNGKSYASARGSLFAYDEAAAKAYLEKALATLGVAAGDIKLRLMANDSSYSQTQAAYLQQQWKEKLGIEAEILPMAWKARVEAQQTGDYDLFVEGWGPSENDAITFLENYTSNAPNNFCGYQNPTYDELMAKAVSEGDLAARQELLIAAEKLLMEDMVIGPMYFTKTTYAISGKLSGVVRTPFQIFSLLDGAKIAS